MVDKSQAGGPADSQSADIRRVHPRLDRTPIPTVVAVNAPLLDRKKYLSSWSISYDTNRSSKLIDDNDDIYVHKFFLRPSAYILTSLITGDRRVESTALRTTRWEQQSGEEAHYSAMQLRVRSSYRRQCAMLCRCAANSPSSTYGVISSTHQPVIIHDERAHYYFDNNASSWPVYGTVGVRRGP